MSISSISNYTLNTSHMCIICVCVLYIYILHLYFYRSRNPSKPICLDPWSPFHLPQEAERKMLVKSILKAAGRCRRGHPSHGWGTPHSWMEHFHIFFQLSWSKLEATRRSGGFKQLKSRCSFFLGILNDWVHIFGKPLPYSYFHGGFAAMFRIVSNSTVFPSLLHLLLQRLVILWMNFSHVSSPDNEGPFRDLSHANSNFQMTRRSEKTCLK